MSLSSDDDNQLEYGVHWMVPILSTGFYILFLPVALLMALWGVDYLATQFFGVEEGLIMKLKWFAVVLGVFIGSVFTWIAMLTAANTKLRVKPQDQMIWVQKGLWNLDHNYIPMQQIIDVDVHQDVTERMLGCATISMLTVRHERIIVRYIQNGMECSQKLLSLIQANGGMMKNTGIILDQ